MASSSSQSAPPKPRKQRFGWVRQLSQAYKLTAKTDPLIGLLLAAVFLLVLAVFVAIGLWVDHPIYFTIVGLPFAVLAALILFGRRAQKAAYASAEGQPGAAAAVLQTLKRGWTVTPGVAVTRQQDIVHRATGRAGVVLVGEGSPARLGPLLAQERKKLGRVAPDVPVYDFQAGQEEGQLRLNELQRKVAKLPRTLSPGQVDEIEKRLAALGSLNLPIPKGPLPRNMRPPRSMR
ncbi:DUF4191 domain-containing protein [Motilibacter aurantiacus]|uniref:DUF4191 domain-containing protein n=1 Tax=Motilibacter aurantiacus TaxID=2714955 RepID=UPI001408619E|nr:DUF4191 domain-containing protein [Motilibacter aurantiacus]NHC44951.1 DUF4191 domain-containing protein [Motilibacter aurantiacus]